MKKHRSQIAWKNPLSGCLKMGDCRIKLGQLKGNLHATAQGVLLMILLSQQTLAGGD
ncbi:MAG: hypothetical protein V3T17_02995 [Pseudomonadales bacterium]